jgi:chromosome partitioning protein
MTEIDVKERPTKRRKKATDTHSSLVQEGPASSGSVRPAKRPFRVVMSSPKGGSGKTGTCRNLAVAAALDHFQVATVDFDPQKTLTRWWEKRPDIAANIDHFAAEIGKVDAVLSGVTSYDFLFYDTAPSVEEHLGDMKKLLVAADLVIVPTQESDDDLGSVMPWMTALRKFQPNAYYVFNKVKPRTNIFMDARNRLVGTGHPLCPVEIPDYTDFVAAGNMGVGILELRKANGHAPVRGVWNFVRATLGVVAP